MGLSYYGWVFRRSLPLTMAFFAFAVLGWRVVVGPHAYLHCAANAVPVWAMLFVMHASRYKVKQTYYRDVLGRTEDH